MYRFKLVPAIVAVTFLSAASGYAQDSNMATIADKNGCKVYNPMPQEDEAISWSGSSFATAVATASHVNGGPVEVRGDIAYWPNETMLYGDVPGLTYVP